MGLIYENSSYIEVRVVTVHNCYLNTSDKAKKKKNGVLNSEKS